MTQPSKPRKTEQERAQEKVGVLERRLQKLNVKKAQLEREARDVAAEAVEVKALLDWLKTSPALKPAPTAPAPDA